MVSGQILNPVGLAPEYVDNMYGVDGVLNDDEISEVNDGRPIFECPSCELLSEECVSQIKQITLQDDFQRNHGIDSFINALQVVKQHHDI